MALRGAALLACTKIVETIAPQKMRGEGNQSVRRHIPDVFICVRNNSLLLLRANILIDGRLRPCVGATGIWHRVSCGDIRIPRVSVVDGNMSRVISNRDRDVSGPIGVAGWIGY
jgi:hypothetical protein